MSLEEPIWRRQLHEAAQAAVPAGGTGYVALMRLVERYLSDGFDPLVQAIARGDLASARAILMRHYPGSLERQQAIEQMLRGELDG